MDDRNGDAIERAPGAWPKKPVCRLTGTDGNVFASIGRVKNALCDAGHAERASEFVRRAFAAGSHHEVLKLGFEHVEVR